MAGARVEERTIDKVSPRHKIKRPSFYVVVVHNDPYTPRTFVVQVLKKYFGKNEQQATQIMLLAHNYGVGVVEKFSNDIAEAKAKQVNEYCRDQGYPLHFSVEDE